MWKMKENEMYQNALNIFSTVGLARFLGMELVAVADDECELSMPVDERHSNYIGGLHGGAAAALLDTAAFFPGSLLPSGIKLATEGIEVHLFRPVPLGEKVFAQAKILRSGRRIVTVELTLRMSGGKQAAHAIATLVDIGE